jgi:hypothetical protein
MMSFGEWLWRKILNWWDPPFRIVCSRCHKQVAGAHQFENGFTAGYYDIGGSWERFANPGERYLCDMCMWTDSRYIAVYGKVYA